ncbi:MAG TPA: IS200/IS605 family transposase [Candidatus Limnocylindria bacterium]|nr:IS200/IS605 family transposase [Candidatus Limnocylindria bacterium]
MPVYRRMSHCVFLCDFHLVWPTKYRRKIFNEGVQGYLKEFLASWPEHHPDIILKTVNTDQDHIHLLVSIPPTRSVGMVVGTLKSVTAAALNDNFPHLRKTYWGTRSIWSAGYFASTVGINEEVIRRYIENQGKDDAGHTNLRLV